MLTSGICLVLVSIGGLKMSIKCWVLVCDRWTIDCCVASLLVDCLSTIGPALRLLTYVWTCRFDYCCSAF